MKQVSTDTKSSSTEQPENPAIAPETATAGDSAGPDAAVRLPGKLEHWRE